MKYALSKAHLEDPVHVSSDGQDAIDYLAGSAPYADRAVHPLPQCVFLDLKLPLVHGFEVLRWIRNEPALSRLLVFILTSSSESRDRQKAQELGANAYLLKPPSSKMLLEVMTQHGCAPSPQMDPSTP